MPCSKVTRTKHQIARACTTNGELRERRKKERKRLNLIYFIINNPIEHEIYRNKIYKNCVRFICGVVLVLNECEREMWYSTPYNIIVTNWSFARLSLCLCLCAYLVSVRMTEGLSFLCFILTFTRHSVFFGYLATANLYVSDSLSCLLFFIQLASSFKNVFNYTLN